MSTAPKTVAAHFEDHQKVMAATLNENASFVEKCAEHFVRAFKAGGKVLLFGNGGSAADAQHIAAEFINRFYFDRPALPAIALTTDTSVLTAIGNDSAYDFVFARQIEALAKPGDVVVAISTSGQSQNVIKGIEAAKAAGASCIGLTGARGKETMGTRCDVCLVVPATDTARIQEAHEFFLHVVAAVVESSIFTKS